MRLSSVYPGIDLRYYFDGGQPRFDFIVQPGADPSQIRFSMEGAEAVYVKEGQTLAFRTRFGEAVLTKLYAYQGKRSVESRFVAEGGTYRIAVGAYDPTQPLIIDPLVWSTFLGGSGSDGNFYPDIAIDGSGSAYITGDTGSNDFPTTTGAYDQSFSGGDAFVTKLSPNGDTLVYSTFLGGNDSEDGYDIAVDASGSAYITGRTVSTDFPTTSGAYDQSYNDNGQYGDVFVTKLSPNGDALVYSTFLGGNDREDGYAIAIDASSCAYITGITKSSDFPTTPGAYDPSLNGGSWDAFVTKLSPTGSSLVYSTFLGGSSNDVGSAIAIDASGCAYITGGTSSTDFPTTTGAYDQSFSGGDAFVTKLSPNGDALVYSTFLGGSSNDWGYGIAVDASGCTYITGWTASTDFPTTSGAYDPSYNGGSWDAFVTKLSPNGDALVYSTFLGGSNGDGGNAIAVEGSGSAFITGSTYSPNFPTTPSAYDSSHNGSGDVFVAKLSTDQTTPIAIPHSPTLVLHPNPTRGAFTIETPTGGTFELLNTQGQRLRTYTLPAGTHTLHEPLPAGTYLLHETRSGATSKLLIQP
ncbi:MAG: hypothetical protein KatS3mg025_0744 [Bacteroidia bacterium]|nr:MAG: hypothetical protein KatS3mg025_0744 [Bacteroidia bacterium]